MTRINPNDPAFPVPIAGCTDGCVYNSIEQSGDKNGGLTIHAHIAAMAMQGMMDAYIRGDVDDFFASSVAKESCKLADALIAQLNKEAHNDSAN